MARGGPTCLTDSAISGPMPSPGKRVARINLEPDAAEEKLRSRKLGFAEEKSPPARLRVSRLTICDAIDAAMASGYRLQTSDC